MGNVAKRQHAKHGISHAGPTTRLVEACLHKERHTTKTEDAK